MKLCKITFFKDIQMALPLTKEFSNPEIAKWYHCFNPVMILCAILQVVKDSVHLTIKWQFNALIDRHIYDGCTAKYFSREVEGFPLWILCHYIEKTLNHNICNFLFCLPCQQSFIWVPNFVLVTYLVTLISLGLFTTS